jgi:hypothetical protein
MLRVLLGWIGYAKVPLEVVELTVQTRLMWEQNPSDKLIGTGLKQLENWLRSCRKLQ